MSDNNKKQLSIPLALFITALLAVASGSWALSTTVAFAQAKRNKEHIMALENDQRQLDIEQAKTSEKLEYIKERLDEVYRLIKNGH